MSEKKAGGRTPLADGLLLAAHLLPNHHFAHETLLPLPLLLSDGRANVSLSGATDRAPEDARKVAGVLAAAGILALAVNCEKSIPRLSRARSLAGALSARHLRLDELALGTLAGSVRDTLDRLQNGADRRR